jgi:hypothetical protein
MSTELICGQPSWRIANKSVEAYVTETGGHLSPVTFDLGERQVQPFLVAPWAEEPLPPDIDDVLRMLRGDFFCMPFSAGFMPDDGNRYPPHGESATRQWHLDEISESEGMTRLRASMEWSIRPGRVTKTVTLVEGQTAVYSRHVVEGVEGTFSYGVHPTLKLPDEEGCAFVSVAPFDVGEVCPFPFEVAENGGYQALRVGALFDSLSKVPRIDGSAADLSRYPARKGYEDFVIMRTQSRGPFGWAAVSVPSRGYLWLSLKDPRVLPLSLMWLSNGGRYYAPWNGRNVCVLGMEEAALDVPLGPASDSMQKLCECPTLSADRKLVVNTIIALAAIPEGFEHVVNLRRTASGVEAVSQSGKAVHVPLNVSFLSEAD